VQRALDACDLISDLFVISVLGNLMRSQPKIIHRSERDVLQCLMLVASGAETLQVKTLTRANQVSS
jgi:hypothetical protein